jgi:hypothetical protein
MTVLGEKLAIDPWIDQPSCCELGREPFFSGVVPLLNYVDNFAKGSHIQELPVGSIREAYVDWSRKRTCRVHQVSPTGCTSIRITVTLGYE